jgi:hypothetical protein
MENPLKQPITRLEYLILLVALLLGILIFMKQCNKQSDIVQTNTIYEHIGDSTIHYKNKYNEQVSKVSLLQGSNEKLLLSIVSTNKTINWLQQEVDRYKGNIHNGGNVTVIGDNTTYTATTSTSVIISPVNNKDSLPTYKTESKDTTWIKYKITANKDSTNLQLKIKNQYTVIIGQEKISLFKKTPIVFVTNKNPYTLITELKAFKVESKLRNHVGMGLQAGYGIGLFTYKPEPFIGIGIHYNILNLW